MQRTRPSHSIPTIRSSCVPFTPFLPTRALTGGFPNAQANEDLRAQYRYLDLRREALARNIQKRARVTKLIRDYLDEQGE
jgi:hypothetical protein